MPDPKANIIVVAGTRPEAIKLEPVLTSLKNLLPAASVRLIATGQHLSLFNDTLHRSGLAADIARNLMQPGQTPARFLTRAAYALSVVFREQPPDLVIVQGDTASAYAGALAATRHNIAVAHVEAGLRTPTLNAPFPEELFRRAIARLACLHFAPTDRAVRALTDEGIATSQIHMTGNSGIDPLFRLLETGLTSPLKPLADKPDQRFGLVTVHRRENHGIRLQRIATALQNVAVQQDMPLILPLHPSPALAPLRAQLSRTPHIRITDPLPYDQMIYLQTKAALVLTDSGGVQEECATLGTPVVILRDETERMEAVEDGRAILAGADPDAIVSAAATLLAHGRFPPSTLFGDGQASVKIARIIACWLETVQASPRTNEQKRSSSSQLL